MDAFELLKTWPEWSKAGIKTVISSPAWRIMSSLDGNDVKIVRTDEEVQDAITLSVTFDGAPALLAITDSELHPDLHLLWNKRNDLPKEILLALVEKECGDVFSIMESITRKMFSIIALSDDALSHKVMFSVEGLPATLKFALDFPAELLPAFGSIENLDTSHPVIRESKRDAWAVYDFLKLEGDELEMLKAGDLVLKTGELFNPVWINELPSDDAILLIGIEKSALTFGEYADENLPPVPPAEEFFMVQNGRTIARVRSAKVGAAAAFCVEERM